jgi:Putative binding domain, N-terminal
MGAVYFKKRVPWMLVVMMMVIAFDLSGCGSDGSSPTGDTGDSGNTGETACALIPYTGIIYVIGDVEGVLADEIEETFVNRIDYDGVSTDAPIFVAAEEVPFLSDITRQGISDTYWNLYPIVVVDGDEAENNALLEMLGLEQNYTLPEDIPYSELFAVDREGDGHTFTWSMYPPDEEPLQPEDADSPPAPAYTDNAEDQCRRAVIFREWINNDNKRVTQEVAAVRLEAMRALAEANGDETGELTKLAHGFVKTRTFSFYGNNYQLTYYIYACHSFNAADATDYDWFYVRQEGMFNASAAYQKIHWYESNPWDYCGLYIGRYNMDNFMDELTSEESGVILLSANPENAVNVSQVTSGVDLTIGGSVGFSVGMKGPEGSASLSGGVTIHNSTTVNVSDCAVENNSIDKVNNAKWSYVFPRCTQINYIWYSGLTDPPVLSRGNFQPVNQWIWKFSPEVRNAPLSSAFLSIFDFTLVASVGGDHLLPWIPLSPIHYTYTTKIIRVWVPLPYPPLIVVPQNEDFSKEAQHKSMDIATARDWRAESDQDWCRIEPSSGTGENLRVNITVDANETGKSRTAKLTFKLTDNTGSDSMTVFQAQY